MTVQEALEITDEMKPNMMSTTLKLRYLTEIEDLIWDEIISKHEDPPEDIEEKPTYDDLETDGDTELIIEDPYSMVYVYWLMSKIDIQNQEDARYNIDRAHFENAY